MESRMEAWSLFVPSQAGARVYGVINFDWGVSQYPHTSAMALTLSGYGRQHNSVDQQMTFYRAFFLILASNDCSSSDFANHSRTSFRILILYQIISASTPSPTNSSLSFVSIAEAGSLPSAAARSGYRTSSLLDPVLEFLLSSLVNLFLLLASWSFPRWLSPVTAAVKLGTDHSMPVKDLNLKGCLVHLRLGCFASSLKDSLGLVFSTSVMWGTVLTRVTFWSCSGITFPLLHFECPSTK